jgi:gluconolactonase
MKSSLAIALLSCMIMACATQSNELFISKDHTAEKLFTNNIEGPAFDKAGNLYVVNYERDGTVGLVKPDGSTELFLSLPEGSTANSIQFDSHGNMFLADFTGHNVLKVDMKTKAITVHAYTEDFNQPNDLCMNKKDQLFASDPNWKDGTGKLWRIETNGETILLEDSLGTTNGITLSPDEKTLYVNESVQRKIWKYDVDEAGNIANKKLLAEFSDYGFDGMKCDSEGNLYVTRYDKGVVLVLTPEGREVREVSLKGKKCSNLVFGGKDGKTIFVTLQDRGAVEKFSNDKPG